MFCLFSGLLLAGMGTTVAKVEVTQVRATHGVFGPTRAENSYLAGDIVFLSFDIGGLQADKEGRQRFRVKMAVLDGGNKAHFSDEQNLPAVGTVMGGRIRHAVQYAIPRDQEPGTYRINVVVTDLGAQSQTEATFTYEYQQLPSGLGLVRFHASLDRFGQVPVPPVGVVGQMLSLHTTALGFKHDKKTTNANITVEFQLLDASDRPVNAKPLLSEFKDIPAETTFVPLRFDLLLQRPGQFKLVFKVTDTVEKKSASITVPLQVVESAGK